MTLKITIRAAICADAAAIARVHVKSERGIYPKHLPADFWATQSYDQRKRQWGRTLCTEGSHRFAYVAIDNETGQIFGFACGGPQPLKEFAVYQGELYAVFLLEDYHRRGIGRELIVAVAGRLAADGVHSMLVWLSEDNYMARSFYQKLGAHPVQIKTSDIAGTALSELAYGWDDTSGLIASSKIQYPS
jgi:ribosomal protein S18 acetylase RimI-like enzyme